MVKLNDTVKNDNFRRLSKQRHANTFVVLKTDCKVIIYNILHGKKDRAAESLTSQSCCARYGSFKSLFFFYLLPTQIYQSACTNFFYSTTVTMVKVHETGMVSLFYFIYSNIGYFNDTLTTGLEMSSVFFSEFWSP